MPADPYHVIELNTNYVQYAFWLNPAEEIITQLYYVVLSFFFGNMMKTS